MTRHLVTSLVLLGTASTAAADFVPMVLDQFDGSVSHTVTRDLAYSAGAGNIAGANWAGFGATTGTKSFLGTFNASSTGYASNTVFGSMAQAGGALALDLLVPIGATLAGGGTAASNARVAYSGSFDLSGKGGYFYFHLASTSATDASLGVAILSGGTLYAAVVATGPSGPRYVEIAFTSLMSATGVAYTGTGSSVSQVVIGLAANTAVGSGRSAALYEFGVVPTPASAALLCIAAIMPRRRRRN